MKALKLLLGLVLLLLLAPFVLGSMVLGNRRERRQKRTREESDETIGRAEKKIGRAFPAALRDFYRSGRHRRSTRQGEFYGLDGAVREYLMLTRKPYGPGGQDWPANLFPVADLLHGYGAVDLDTGEVVEWDPDEIAGGEDESDEAWARAFTRTGKTLAQWAG